MKELILNPLVLIPLVLILIAYFFLLLKYSSRQTSAPFIEKFFFAFFLFTLLGIAYFPFVYMAPSALAGFDKKPESALAQIGVYLVLIIIARLGFKHFFENVARAFSKCPSLGGIILISVLSTFWSEAPEVTIRYSLVLLVMSAYAAHLANRHSWEAFSAILRWSFSLILSLSLFVCLAIPSIGVNGKGWSGILDHPIALGCMAAFNVALWCSHLMARRSYRKTALAFVGLSLIVMKNANSATGIFVLVALLSVIGWSKILRNFKSKQVVLIFIASLITTVIIVPILTSESSQILGLVDKDPSLTGRTDFWPQLLEHMKQHPFIGYGVQGFWQPWRGAENPASDIINPNGFIPPHAHNGFLEVGLQLGAVGAILLSISFFSNSVKAIKTLATSHIAEPGLPLVFLIYVILFNLSSSALIDTGYVWFFYMFMTFRLALGNGEQSSNLSSSLSKGRNILQTAP